MEKIKNWTIEDYCDLYHERAGIMEYCGGELRNQANLAAYNEVFKKFMQEYLPTDDEIILFKKLVSKRDR